MFRPALWVFVSVFFSAQLFLSPTIVSARTSVDDNNLAVKFLEKGRFLEAVELLKKSHAVAPYDQVIRQNLVISYQAAGQAYVRQSRYAELAELMLEAQEFDDMQRGFWSMRGFALLRLKQYYAAETDLQEARAMGDPDATILSLLGELYYDTDRMYEAFDAFESAQLHDSDNPNIARMLEKVRRELAVEKDMDKEYGGHFVITFDGDQNDDLGREVLDVLDEAYNWLGSQLDHYPDERVTVILYSRKQFSALTNSPEWAGGLYDGKIRLPVGGISSVNAAVKSLLYHEYTHVALRDIAGTNLPYWLNEGLAEVGEAHIVQPELDVLALARDQLKLFRLASLEGPFRGLQGLQVSLAYQQSYSVVRYLIDEYGWHHVRDLVFAFENSSSIEQAIEMTLGGYGLTYRSLEESWRESG